MIKENVATLLHDLPRHVQLVAAAKNRSLKEIEQALAAGIRIIGENYVQEAEAACAALGARASWHLIGHLQKNKVKRAVKLFDMIETLDSPGLAAQIDKACARENKVMPVLIQINSAKEQQKSGVMPEEAEELVKDVAALKNIKIMGLMTMGPATGEPEEARPYFARTKKIFDKIKNLPLARGEMKYLSMGMSNSYRVAIAEGANIIRVGSKIFGER